VTEGTMGGWGGGVPRPGGTRICVGEWVNRGGLAVRSRGWGWIDVCN